MSDRHKGWVLITGGGRGLGNGLVAEFSSRGYGVITIVRSPQAQARIFNAFKGLVGTILCDLLSPILEQRIDAGLRSMNVSSLDCLINNAAIPSHPGSLSSLDIATLKALIDVNLIGAVRVTKTCVPYLAKGSSPIVINMSSRLGSLAATSRRDRIECSYSYRISKAALNMFTLCSAFDCELVGVKVISVHPGLIRTEMGGLHATDSVEQAGARIGELFDRRQVIETGTFVNAAGGLLEW